MENILQAQKKIDAVYTHDDDMAQGVVQAIRNADREDEMFLTGVGGSQDAMKQIKAGGLYRATFLYNPNMAATAVNMARLIALGEGFSELVPPEVPRQLIVPAAVVTKDNVGEVREVRVRLRSTAGGWAKASSMPSQFAHPMFSPLPEPGRYGRVQQSENSGSPQGGTHAVGVPRGEAQDPPPRPRLG